MFGTYSYISHYSSSSYPYIFLCVHTHAKPHFHLLHSIMAWKRHIYYFVCCTHISCQFIVRENSYHITVEFNCLTCCCRKFVKNLFSSQGTYHIHALCTAYTVIGCWLIVCLLVWFMHNLLFINLKGQIEATQNKYYLLIATASWRVLCSVSGGAALP